MELRNTRNHASSLTPPVHYSRRLDHRWSGPWKFAAGVSLITLVALSTIKGLQFYTYYQNGKIDSIDCQFGQKVDGVVRDFQYYKNAAEKYGSASDQYCVAQLYAKGVETQQSLGEAKLWYKRAYEQGLVLAAWNLCKSDMYEYQYGSKEEYFASNKIFHEYVDQFADICCPAPCTFIPALCIAPRCPWEKEYSTLRRTGY